MDIDNESLVGLYGLMAEFTSPEELLAATEAAYAEGYRNMDAYTPFPITGVAEALGSRRTWVAPMVGTAAILGAIGGFGLMTWIAVVAYPFNIAGRPFFSWPAWIPVTFETTILLASLTAVFGMFALCGFPEPYHPVFNVPRFGLASKDRFFLCIEADDPKFTLDSTRDFMRGFHGVAEVTEVAL